MSTATSAANTGKDSPLAVSIVIPVLNEAETLPPLLDALARLPVKEVLVVDGGSSDGTVAAAASHGKAHLIPARRGRALQLNAGAAHATGDVLLFLHADTRLPGNALTELTDSIAGGARWGRFDVRLDDHSRWFRIVERAMNLRSAVTGIATGDQAIFVRSEDFRRIGGFPALPLMEDVALSKRLRAQSRPARLRGPVVTSARKWRREGIVRTMARMWLLRALFALGVPAARLHGIYYRGESGPAPGDRS